MIVVVVVVVAVAVGIEVFLLRLSPLTPYSVLSYLLATTQIGTLCFEAIHVFNT
jgi:uncharacterized membrane protein YdjX (TVP38/TMEM64 family)